MIPHISAYDPGLIDFDLFALFLQARRVHRGKTECRAAREAEVEIDALRRAERGRNPGGHAFFRLCAWMGEDPASFIRRDLAAPRPSPALARACP